jgi:hypothetical protein
MFPLSADFGFSEIVDGETPASKVTLPLPEFPLSKFQGNNDACVLALPNGRQLNQVFEQASVANGPRPDPSAEASKEAVRKRKLDASAGPTGKRIKVAGKKEGDYSDGSCRAKGYRHCFIKGCLCAPPPRKPCQRLMFHRVAEPSQE